MNKKKSAVSLLLFVQILALAVTGYASLLAQEQGGEPCAGDCSASSTISSSASLSQQPVTIHIPADYPTIQQGIDAAEYGDTVLVAAGTYPEHIDMKSGVIVRGTGGSLSTADDPADDAIIDGELTDRVVDFSYSVKNATLEGFTITRGRGAISGGNIKCYGKANRIKDNLIVDGRTTGSYGGYGGGIYLACDSAKVVGNVIQNN